MRGPWRPPAQGAISRPPTRPVSSTVLVVKLAAIGDVVMALPMLAALRAREPQVRVTWLCGQTVEPLLARIPGIDELVAVDDGRLLGGTLATRVAVVMDAWRKLRGRRFDDVYLAHADRRYRALLRTVRAGNLHSLEARAGRPGMLPGRAHRDEYVRLVTGLDDFRARSFPSPEPDVTLPTTLAARLPPGPKVALAPGGAHNAARDNPLRRWPVDRYAELARRLLGAGVSVILTGSRSDAWVQPHFAGLPTLDLIGCTDLPSLVALYRQCAAVVTHDSGPLHLAALAGAPVIALFGPTPPSSFAVPDGGVQVLWPGRRLPCAPCYDGREFAACASNACMQAIGVDDVAGRLAAFVRA